MQRGDLKDRDHDSVAESFDDMLHARMPESTKKALFRRQDAIH